MTAEYVQTYTIMRQIGCQEEGGRWHASKRWRRSNRWQAILAAEYDVDVVLRS